jgi:single-stranded DNA-specific DHH superfamily exonuclease
VTELERLLRSATAILEGAGRSFALVGGLAVSVRADPRLTRDADLVVAVSTEGDAQQVLMTMIANRFRVVATIEQLAAGRLATARLVTDHEGVVLDLLFASSGIEPEIVAAAETVEVLPGLELPVASVGHLIAMKLLARDDRHRPQDADDLLALSAIASAADWAEASEAVGLIVERGFARQRDLLAALAELQATGTY